MAAQEPEASSPEGTPENGAAGASADDDRLPHQRWQGKSTKFMRSNEHGGDRSGVWSTEGLEGAALSIVAGDEKSGRCAPVRDGQALRIRQGTPISAGKYSG